jgi:polysaccharide export outer membrane protein
MVVGNQSEQGELDSFALAATLRGDEPSNPFVRPGDIVTVAVADQAYVIGNVLRPQPIPLREPVTVSKAIAMSGGTLPDTKADKVRIIRQDPVSGAKSEILVDLRGIEKLQANDPELRAGDILEIPTSSGKRFLRTMLGGVSTSAAQLPIRIIP